MREERRGEIVRKLNMQPVKMQSAKHQFAKLLPVRTAEH